MAQQEPLPQGFPDSLTCRWCDAVRMRVRSTLLCAKCDAPDHAIATWRVA